MEIASVQKSHSINKATEDFTSLGIKVQLLLQVIKHTTEKHTDSKEAN